MASHQSNAVLRPGERPAFGPFQAIIEDGQKRLQLGRESRSGEFDRKRSLEVSDLKSRLTAIAKEERFARLHRIDAELFRATVEYFHGIGSQWCNLPLTTRMISSPGEVYAGKTLDYTTDALPVELSWFDEKRPIFLSESSQFYLELRLLVPGVEKVFSIYNSFRKERADFCHLSEFQHIEFEGKVSLAENVQIGQGLVQHLVRHLLSRCPSELAAFVGEEGLWELHRSVEASSFETIDFEGALELLHRDTGDPAYKKFSMEHFGAWEEVRLTEIIGKNVWVTEFPLLEIPFYHNAARGTRSGKTVAENADLIMFGYREILGAGARMKEIDALREKARVFNLPPEDYAPYLETRCFDHYVPTAGFGMGWQRLLQWILREPYIWDVVHIPRGHLNPIP